MFSIYICPLHLYSSVKMIIKSNHLRIGKQFYELLIVIVMIEALSERCFAIRFIYSCLTFSSLSLLWVKLRGWQIHLYFYFGSHIPFHARLFSFSFKEQQLVFTHSLGGLLVWFSASQTDKLPLHQIPVIVPFMF